MSQSTNPPSRFLPYLTTDQVADLPKEQAVIVLPIASIERHGPHLPIYTDSIIVKEVLNRTPFMGPLTFAWLTKDITATGVVGDATTADPVKGEHFLSDAATQIADMLRDISNFHFVEQNTQL